jgi:TusA-related sulfurtransferase
MSDKKTKMKITELRNKLNQLTKQELIKLLVDSYKMNEDIQQYLISQLTQQPVILNIPNEDVKENNGVIQITVWKKWMEIPAAARERLLGNVWCGRCSKAVTIREFTIQDERFGLVLKGSCAVCGQPVARVVEND